MLCFSVLSSNRVVYCHGCGCCESTDTPRLGICIQNLDQQHGMGVKRYMFYYWISESSV